MTTPAVAGEIVSGEGSIINEARAAAQYGRADEIAAAARRRQADAGRQGRGRLFAIAVGGDQWARQRRATTFRERRGLQRDGVGGVLEENALQWACRQGRSSCAVLLRESGGDPTHRGKEGGTAVHLCCRYGQVAILAFLIARDDAPPSVQRGLVDLPDGNGMTPLMVCCEWYWSRPKKALDCLRLLLAFGASATFADKQQRTPLHVAAKRGVEAKALELLIEKGASTEAEDSEGHTAAKVAEQAGHSSCARHIRMLASTSSKRRPWATARKDEDVEAPLVERMAPLKPLPFAVELRSGPLACRDALYGLGTPCLVLLGGPSLIARYGWHVGLGCSVVSAFSFAFLAPRDAPRYGHCGFAVGSVLAIVRSFFLVENVGIGLVVLYAVLVSCLLGALAMTALSDPGMRPRPFLLRVDGVTPTPSARRRVGSRRPRRHRRRRRRDGASVGRDAIDATQV